MSGGSLLFMAIVWCVIIGCTGHCFYRLLTSNRDFTSQD